MNLSTTDLGQVELSDAASAEHELRDFYRRLGDGVLAPCRLPAWPAILRDGLDHRPYWLTVRENGRLAGCLPLCFVGSRLFGRFLTSLPYLNSVGVAATGDEAARALIDRTVALADELEVRYSNCATSSASRIRHSAAM